MDEDNTILGNIESKKERKNLRTILNRGKFDPYELEDFMTQDE